MLKPLRLAALALALILPAGGALAQATQVPPGETCFQAQTGVSGMIGTLGAITVGSGGTAGTYANVALTGGSGSAATANITVAGGVVTAVVVFNPGSQYVVGDVLSAASGTIGGVTGFSVPVASTSINSSLAGGSVGFYIPSTSSSKQTWKDAGQTVLNTNPVALDANGCALIYGTGVYRQVLKDSLGNTVWDQPTTSISTNQVWAGLAGGTGNAITITDPSFTNVSGQSFQFIASASNSGAVSITVNGSTTLPARVEVSGGPQPLIGGEILTGSVYTVVLDPSLSFFHILGQTINYLNITGGVSMQGGLSVGGTSSLSGAVNISGQLVGAGGMSMTGGGGSFIDSLSTTGNVLIGGSVTTGVGGAFPAPYNTLGSIVVPPGVGVRATNTIHARGSFTGTTLSTGSFNITSVSSGGLGISNVLFTNLLNTPNFQVSAIASNGVLGGGNGAPVLQAATKSTSGFSIVCRGSITGAVSDCTGFTIDIIVTGGW